MIAVGDDVVFVVVEDVVDKINVVLVHGDAVGNVVVVAGVKNVVVLDFVVVICVVVADFVAGGAGAVAVELTKCGGIADVNVDLEEVNVCKKGLLLGFPFLLLGSPFLY